MPCYSPLDLIQRDGCKILVAFKYGMKGRRMNIPCGRCIGCRLERARQWAMRCGHEMQMHKENWFLTLTYSDEELVWGDARPTLCPQHLQKFWKRLRKETNAHIRYFACGEYGEHTYRPHYHAIIFGYDFKDKQYHKIENGHKLYRSDMLDRIWSHGNCIIGGATFESAAYIARYICGKKLGDQADYYEREKIEPEFLVMSKRPGIGALWFDKYHKEVYPSDKVLVRGTESSAPRYYLNRLAKMDPQLHESVNYIRLNRAVESFQDENNTGRRLKVRGRIRARMQFSRGN